MPATLYVNVAIWLAKEIVAWFVLAACFALPVAVLVHVARRRRASGEPQCSRCGYLLIGLPEPRCPECGTPFTPGAEPTSAAPRLTFVQRWCVTTGVIGAFIVWLPLWLVGHYDEPLIIALNCALAYLVLATTTAGVWPARAFVISAFGAACFLDLWHDFRWPQMLVYFCAPPVVTAFVALARWPGPRISRTGLPRHRPPSSQ